MGNIYISFKFGEFYENNLLKLSYYLYWYNLYFTRL